MPLRKTHFTILIAALVLLATLSSVYMASRILVPSFIRKNVSALLGVPVHVQSGGINLFNTTFWIEGLEIGNVPGSRERFFLSLKYFEFNLSFTSFLANELIVEDIRFVDPVLNLERDLKGELNSDRLMSQLKQSFRPRFKIGKFKFFHHYAIRHLSIKNGTFRHYNQNAPADQKEWLFREIDFSFSEFDYPPKLNSPVTTSFYMSAKLSGQEEGKIRILGSGNFISNDKNFRVKSHFQNIALRDLNSLIPNPSQSGADGFSDIESAFNCEHNLLKITNKVRLREVSFPENGEKKFDEVVFGFSRKTLSQFFALTRDQLFQFDFSVSGKLTDPSFDLKQALAQSFFNSAHEELNRVIDRLNSESLKQVEKLMAGGKNGGNNPAEILKQLIEKFSEKSSSKKLSAGNSASSKT